MSGRSLSIDIIENGLVIDHIKAGNCMKIYSYLNLDKLDCTVAIIKNVKSKKHAFKDLIKIENNLDIDYEVIGFLDPNVTINIIKDGKIISKTSLELPKSVKNIVKCKNPRCICSIEQDLEHVFELSDAEKETYRCIFCRQEADKTAMRNLY